MRDGKGEVLIRMLPVTELTPDIEFAQLHNLDENSHCAKWFRAFLPNSRPTSSARTDKLCTNNWCTYTNTRAMLDIAGKQERGGAYHTFVQFTPAEIEQYLALNFLQGLILSPSLSKKFSPQGIDPIEGNDLVAQKLGKNAVKRHQKFRRWFDVRNPLW